MAIFLPLPDRMGGNMKVEHVVFDFTGTLSKDGILFREPTERQEDPPKLAGLLAELATHVKVHVMTADTHGMVKVTLREFPLSVEIVNTGEDKPILIAKFDPGLKSTVFIGNGHNDMAAMMVVRFGIVTNAGEGVALDLMLLGAERGFVYAPNGPCEAIELLLKAGGKRAYATTRE